jgi:putative flippase GtrA
VSSPSLARRTARAELSDGLAREVEQGAEEVRSFARRAVERLRRDDVPAQFGRFVLVGGISSLLYALVFILGSRLGDQPANLIGSVLSSMLANELHRRLTFHAGERVSWLTAQWEGGGMALVGMVATALALAWWDATTDTGAFARFVVVAAVTGAIGLVRFVALRWAFGAIRTADEV